MEELATKAELNSPGAVAFDAAGNMYIPDTVNNRVRLVRAVDGAITAGSTITTIAGNGTPAYSGDGGAADQAELRGPSSVAIDAAGNVWIADTGNNAIRKVGAATSAIATVMGAGVGNSYAGGKVNTATLNSPNGIVLDATGDLFVADTRNTRVREIEGNVAALAFMQPVRQFETSAPMIQKIENDGNEAPILIFVLPSQQDGMRASTKLQQRAG